MGANSMELKGQEKKEPLIDEFHILNKFFS